MRPAVKLVSEQVRRPQVVYARLRGPSARRACALLEVARSNSGYRSLLAVKDAPVKVSVRDMAMRYAKFRYPRIQVFLERQRRVMSNDQSYRQWRQVGCRCRGSGLDGGYRSVDRRASRPPGSVTSGPTTLSILLTNGQQLKCLMVFDEYRREWLAIGVAGGVRSGVILVLTN